jgi:hypothetical protein
MLHTPSKKTHIIETLGRFNFFDATFWRLKGQKVHEGASKGKIKKVIQLRTE